MTTLTASTRATGSAARLLATAAVAGAVLGIVDLALQLTLAYPFANLANSSAVWALCAFGFASRAHRTPALAAAAGAMLLLVAVEAYYVTAIVTGHADLSALWSNATQAWLAFGVAAGAVFGVAGTWLRSPRPWASACGLATGAAVFFAEGGVRLLPESGSALDDLATVLLTFALGVTVLLTSVDRPARLARAVVLVGPLTLLGVLAFAVAGF